MSVIGIVDDRQEYLDTTVGLVRRDLKKLKIDWKVISTGPLATPSDYPAWIRENEVCVLLIDERLNEIEGDTGKGVDYPGHQVTDLIRSSIPDFPQFIFTAINDFSDSDESAKNVDGIIPKGDFNNNRPTHLLRMVRAGERYVDRHERSLAEIAEIANRIAQGKHDGDDLERLSALRLVARGEFLSDDAPGQLTGEDGAQKLTDMSVWIREADELCRRLEAAISAVHDRDHGGG